MSGTWVLSAKNRKSNFAFSSVLANSMKNFPFHGAPGSWFGVNQSSVAKLWNQPR
ncbi:Uncharacterised protein [Mycobacteroides abscessus subsp. abscessus]|nr:Uncharacterised protein [Mycobacteroides abscessus subsp. abscessus]